MTKMFGVAQVKNVARTSAGGTIAQRMTFDGAAFSASYLWALAHEGRIYVASDGDENDTVTGQTSFAATTPTFLLDVPDGTVAVPLWVNLAQAGTVAGDSISIHISIDNANRYSSGGTAESSLALRTDAPNGAAASTLYSGATAGAASSARSLFHKVLAEDVDPASADVSALDLLWVPPAPILLVGDAALLVFTYAGTTGPTWRWSIGWAELPESALQ